MAALRGTESSASPARSEEPLRVHNPRPISLLWRTTSLSLTTTSGRRKEPGAALFGQAVRSSHSARRLRRRRQMRRDGFTTGSPPSREPVVRHRPREQRGPARGGEGRGACDGSMYRSATLSLLRIKKNTQKKIKNYRKIKLFQCTVRYSTE